MMINGIVPYAPSNPFLSLLDSATFTKPGIRILSRKAARKASTKLSMLRVLILLKTCINPTQTERNIGTRPSAGQIR